MGLLLLVEPGVWIELMIGLREMKAKSVSINIYHVRYMREQVIICLYSLLHPELDRFVQLLILLLL